MRVETQNAAHAVLSEIRDLLGDLPSTTPIESFEEDSKSYSSFMTTKVSFKAGKSRSITVLVYDSRSES